MAILSDDSSVILKKLHAKPQRGRIKYDLFMR